MISPSVLLYRLNSILYRYKVPIIPSLLNWYGRYLFACYFPSSAKISENLSLGYWGLGVVIHSNTVIGDDCRIGQNVTIGRNMGQVRVPVIGNRVYIGAGSVVFGEITIGNNVIIGANSVVNISLPDNAIVVGNPARKIGDTGGKSFSELDKEALERYKITESRS